MPVAGAAGVSSDLRGGRSSRVVVAIPDSDDSSEQEEEEEQKQVLDHSVIGNNIITATFSLSFF